MSTFANQILVSFLRDDFVEDLLENQLGLSTLFHLTYKSDYIELREISLVEVQQRQFQRPAFETIRTTGTEERLMPTQERVQVSYEQPRRGRLEWIDVFLSILVSTKIYDRGVSIEQITTKDLIEELGGIDSLTELRNKLEARYSESIVNAFFQKLRIETIEDFKKKANLFVEFIYQTPPSYDPDNPRSVKVFRLNICVKIQSDLHITEALQTAKLCLSILENERNFSRDFEGGEIERPYVLVTIFSESVAVDNAIPGLNATQIKQGVQDLFVAEGMLARFLTVA